jgi:predicted transcriptional regulator
MPDIQTDRRRTAPSARTDVSPISDDECLIRLARAVEQHDAVSLEEAARMIGRLAVTIE